MDVGLLQKNQVSNTELKFSYDTDLENGTYDCQGRRIGEGIVREFGTDTYTLLHFKWITDKVLLYSTGDSAAQCCMAAWTRGESGGEWIHVHVWLSPSAVHLKLPQHC